MFLRGFVICSERRSYTNCFFFFLSVLVPWRWCEGLDCFQQNGPTAPKVGTTFWILEFGFIYFFSIVERLRVCGCSLVAFGVCELLYLIEVNNEATWAGWFLLSLLGSGCGAEAPVPICFHFWFLFLRRFLLPKRLRKI